MQETSSSCLPAFLRENKGGEGRQVKQIGVVGCGLMGAGIAETAGRAGFDVIAVEVTDEILEKGMDRIRRSVKTAVEKGKLPAEEAERALSRLRGTTRRADLRDCDLVIEAIIESMPAKKEVFAALDQVVKPDAILASNTSSLSITELAAATKRPERVIGLHFFNPVPVMKLLEIVRGYRTSDATVAEARAFGERLKKATILAKDTPGFIVNLLLVPYLLNAARAFAAGLASRDDIDKGAELGLGHPMGPLKLLDYVGLDTTLFIADIMFDQFRDSQYAVPPLVRRMVAAGDLGRKSGSGFYTWSGDRPNV